MQNNNKITVQYKQNFFKRGLNIFSISIGIGLMAISACSKSSNKTNGSAPIITFKGISVDSLTAGSSEILNIQFGFTDNDGDLGNSSSSGNFDIYTFDHRDSNMVNYYFPKGITESIDTLKGVSGTCNLALEAAFIILRPNRTSRDTMQLDLYIKDKAGNVSNTIRIPDIYLVP